MAGEQLLAGVDEGYIRRLVPWRRGAVYDRRALVDALVMKDIQAMRQAPVKDEELANARQFEVRSIPLEVSSESRIARALLDWSYLDEPLDQPMLAARHYLDLTAQEVREAFRKHLRPRHLVQVVAGPAPQKH